MKILFTADWHIKVGQKNVPVEWAKNRFKMMFSQIHKFENRASIHIIGGDIFDKVPSMEELELYYAFVAGVTIPTYIYSGNHEAVKKDTTFLSNLAESTNLVNKLVRVIDNIETLSFNDGTSIDIIPYNCLKSYNPADHDIHSNILCTHVRGEIPPHVKPEVNLDLFDRWQSVLAGDLHSHDNSQRNILYPGSPVTTSFHRSNVDTGAILFDSIKMEYEWLKFSLPQLIRKTVSVGDPMPSTEYDHTIYEVEGDMVALASMEDSSLLDKKIVKRDTDTALILDADMSLETEVSEYLEYILGLSQKDIDAALKELNNHAHKFKSGSL